MFGRAVNTPKLYLEKMVQSFLSPLKVNFMLRRMEAGTPVYVLNRCTSDLTVNFEQVLQRNALFKNDAIGIFQPLNPNRYLPAQS